MASRVDPGTGVSYAIGLDVGTSAVKGAVLTSDGRHASFVSRDYAIATRRPGWAEQNPDDWWTAVGEVLDQVLQAHPEIDHANTVIGLSGQMHTTVIRDSDGAVIRPAILWSDARSAAEAGRLADMVDDWDVIAGYSPISAFTSAHLRWVRDNEPEQFARISTICVPKDDIRLRFGAGWATEPSDGSAMNLLDTRTDQWAPRLLDAVGITPEMLPPIVRSDEVTGEVAMLPPMTTDGTRLVGARVVAGAGDQAAQAYALGATKDREVAVSVGTSGAALQALNEPRAGAFRHCVPSTWLALDSTHAAGLALAWWSRLSGLPVDSVIDATPRAEGDLPIFLPYIQGGRGQEEAPGTLTDLRASHSSEDIMLSVAEGIGIELVRLVRTATQGVIPQRPVGVGGRGARNPMIRAVLAAGLDRPIRYAERGPAYGVAALAAGAAGWWRRHESLRADSGIITPVDPEFAARLQPRIGRFTDLAGRLTESPGLHPHDSSITTQHEITQRSEYVHHV